MNEEDQMAESLKPHNRPKERIVYVERSPQSGKPLPNGTTVLVLGIVSLVFWPAGIPCGIISLNLSGKDKRLYTSNPGVYSVSSFNQLQAGRICGIIGLCLSSFLMLFVVLYFVFVISFFGAIASQAV